MAKRAATGDCEDQCLHVSGCLPPHSDVRELGNELSVSCVCERAGRSHSTLTGTPTPPVARHWGPSLSFDLSPLRLFLSAPCTLLLWIPLVNECMPARFKLLFCCCFVVCFGVFFFYRGVGRGEAFRYCCDFLIRYHTYTSKKNTDTQWYKRHVFCFYERRRPCCRLQLSPSHRTPKKPQEQQKTGTDADHQQTSAPSGGPITCPYVTFCRNTNT